MIIKHFDEPRSRMIRGLTLKLFEHCLKVGFHGATGRRVVRIVVVVHGGLDVIVLARVLSPVGPHRLCGLPYGLLCGVLCGLLCGPGRGCAGTCRVTATVRVTACNTHHQSTFCRLDIAFGTSFGRSNYAMNRRFLEQHTPSEHVLQAPRRRPGRPGARRDTPRRHDSPRQLCEISPPLPHRSLSVFIGCILLPFSRFFVAAFSPRRPLLLVLGAFRLRHVLQPAVPVPYGRLVLYPAINCR